MTEENRKPIFGCPTSDRMEKKAGGPSRQPESPRDWDFECGLASDPPFRQGRMRASSWDDSDDNLPPGPDNSGSKTCRIYSSDDRKFRSSVSSEINELKREFFKNIEKEKEQQDRSKLETVRDEMETKLNYDRRLSPARIRRRSKSSGSSSSLAEAESQISPTKINKPTDFENEVQEINHQSLECNPNYYLTNFFTDLRSRRISLLDSMSALEKLAQDVPNYDGESIPTYDESYNPDGKDPDMYFCKTARKLSKILEVEENKKDVEKSSEENILNSSLFKKCFTKPEGDFSPLQTARSKKSEKIPEKQEETPRKKEGKFRSLSSEYLTSFQKPQKLLYGNITDRSTRFFDQKLDDDFISLSAKTGKTQLTPQKCLEDKQTNTPTFSPRSPKRTDENCSEVQENENDLLKLLKIDLTKSSRSGDRTPRKSEDRSDQATNTNRSKGAKSRKSWNPESPRFMLNIGTDSGRSLKVEDVNPVETEPREEEFSFRKSSSCFSENSSEAKTERMSQKSMPSPSIESGISTRRTFHESSNSQNSTQRSHRKKRKQRTDYLNVESDTKDPNSARSMLSDTKDPNSVRLVQSENKTSNSAPSVKATEERSPIVSSRSTEKPAKTSCRSKCSVRSPSNEILNNCEFVQTPNSKSSRTSKSPKVKTPKTTEDRLPDQLSQQGTPRSKKIPEFGVPLDISERPESQRAENRSLETELQDVTKCSDHLESKRRSWRRSEQSSSSRTRNTECSPRSLKMTPRTNSGSSRRSKDSLENRDEPGNLESSRLTSGKEFEKVSESNRTSISSASRSNRRETEISSQQYSYRDEIYNPELDNSTTMEASEANNTLKEQLSGSRNSSGTSLDSITECLDNNSPDRSAKTKSRPNSWTSKECTSAIPPDVEKLYMNPISGRTDRSSLPEEAEDLEENHSTQRSKIEDESDRFSNKRLSIINEVSFEDLETSNVSTKKKEKNIWDQSKSHSGKKSDRESPETPESYKSVKKISPKDEPNPSGWNPKETSSIDDSTSIDVGKGEEWTDLISKFQTQSHSFILGNRFPGFPHKNNTSWNSIKGSPLEADKSADYDENSEEIGSVRSLQSKALVQDLFQRPLTGEKKLDNPNIAYQNRLLDQDFTPPFQTHQNVHYVNVDKAGPLGIGEFGDVTCWNSGDSDLKDTEKPKEHGDGIPTPEILPWRTEKAEKEVKNQRLLRRDFTDSTPLLSKLFLEAHVNPIPFPLKESKSGSNERLGTKTDFHVRPAFSFLSDSKQTPLEENPRTNKQVKSSRNAINQHSSSDSLECGGDSELDYERLPRLSRSLSNLDIRFEENLYRTELGQSLSMSGDELLKKTPDRYKTEKETTNLNTFLKRKTNREKIAADSNNWLKLKQGRRTKRRLKKKGAVSPREPFRNYLSSRKTRPSVPILKLRHPNCFQNFYKRIISVFCVTSNSSAATSK